MINIIALEVLKPVGKFFVTALFKLIWKLWSGKTLKWLKITLQAFITTFRKTKFFLTIFMDTE
jgi:hypothetical protein